MNTQPILDATALIAGGTKWQTGKYRGAGGIAGVRIAYSLPPPAKALPNDGLVHVSFWDGYEKEPSAGDLAVYRHRIRMQLMLSLGRSELPKAYSILTAYGPLYEAAFNANLNLKATCSSSLLQASPGIVEAIYPGRICLEFMLIATRKEAVTNALSS